MKTTPLYVRKLVPACLPRSTETRASLDCVGCGEGAFDEQDEDMFRSRGGGQDVRREKMECSWEVSASQDWKVAA